MTAVALIAALLFVRVRNESLALLCLPTIFALLL